MKKFPESCLIILFLLVAAVSCKEVPTFDAGPNDPQSPTYKVRKPLHLSVMREFYGFEGLRIFIKPNLGFPFDGARIDAESDGDRLHVMNVPKSSLKTDTFYKGIGFFEIDIPAPPFMNTNYIVQMYYILDGDTLFSEPDTAKLHQSIFDFKLEEVNQHSNEYRISWKNNFMYNPKYSYGLMFLIKKDHSFKSIQHASPYNESVTFHLGDSLDIEPESLGSKIFYQIDSVTEPIQINFEKEHCIQTIGDKSFFLPENLKLSFNKSADEATFSWSNSCEFDELRVYWDTEDNYWFFTDYVPMQLIYTTTENTGEITFPMIYQDYPDDLLWLTAVKNDKETELTLPKR